MCLEIIVYFWSFCYCVVEIENLWFLVGLLHSSIFSHSSQSYRQDRSANGELKVSRIKEYLYIPLFCSSLLFDNHLYILDCRKVYTKFGQTLLDIYSENSILKFHDYFNKLEG